MNALEKLVDLLAACFLLFGLPLLYYNGKVSVIQQMTAGRLCESFLSRSSLFGEINEAFLEDFEREMERCGCAGYELTGERVLYTASRGEMRKVIVKKRKEDFLREVRQAGKSFLIPGDVLMLTVYFDGVPTVYSTAVRSRGDLE